MLRGMTACERIEVFTCLTGMICRPQPPKVECCDSPEMQATEDELAFVLAEVSLAIWSLVLCSL